MTRKTRFLVPACILIIAIFAVCIWTFTRNSSGDDARLRSEDAAITATTYNANGDVNAAGQHEIEMPEVFGTPINAMNEENLKNAQPEKLGVEIEHIFTEGGSGYELSDTERMIVESAVMCEAGAEKEEGQLMVAQCILDAAQRHDMTVTEVIQTYQIMTTSRTPTDSVKDAVSRIFDDGERITEAKADLWYNPAITRSSWHEEQNYVITIGSHRFFWMNG